MHVVRLAGVALLLALVLPPAQAAATDEQWIEDMASALSAGAHPRDQTLGAELRIKRASSDEASEHAASDLFDAARRAPSDRVVQWLAANTASYRTTCTAPCQSAARGFSRLEPDNAASWVPVLARAERDGDRAGMDAAIAAMAASKRHDEPFVDASLAWAEALDRIGFPSRATATAQDTASAPLIAGIALAAATPLGGYSGLALACDPARHPSMTTARRDECARIGRMILETGTTMTARSIAIAVLARSAPGDAVDAARIRAEKWRRGAVWAKFGTRIDPREEARYLRDLQATGNEIEAQSRQLVRLGIALEPPADWQPPN